MTMTEAEQIIVAAFVVFSALIGVALLAMARMERRQANEYRQIAETMRRHTHAD